MGEIPKYLNASSKDKNQEDTQGNIEKSLGFDKKKLFIYSETKKENCDLLIDNFESGIKITSEKSFTAWGELLNKHLGVNILQGNTYQSLGGGKSIILQKGKDDISFIRVYPGEGVLYNTQGPYGQAGEIYHNQIFSKNQKDQSVITPNNNSYDIKEIKDNCTIEDTNNNQTPQTPLIFAPEPTPEELAQIAITSYEKIQNKSQEYKVQSGDTLWKIIKSTYNIKMSESVIDMLEIVIERNKELGLPLTKDSKLKIGDSIYLPNDTEVIQKIQTEDRERRIAFNNKKGIKMKVPFK